MRPGETFDRYRIEGSLGEGGMGKVYRAFDTRLGRHVALKVVTIDPEGEPEAATQAAARILREARAAAALQHPNAVAVYDAGELEGTLYLAMELVTGKTLRTLIAEGNAPWDLRVRWLVEVARALRAAHGLGIIHRDVKPENVMVRTDGVVKVLDFGIAKRVPLTLPTTQGSNAFSTMPTAGGLVVGTPRYMAPEQVKGEPLDPRADEFAWGVVAYELLAGRSPWGTKDGVHLLLAITGEEPEPLGGLAPHLPVAVVATVTRALQKDPEARFPSMQEVVAAMEPFATAVARQGGASNAAETQTDIQPLRTSTPSPYVDDAAEAVAAARSMEPAPRRTGSDAVVLGPGAAYRADADEAFESDAPPPLGPDSDLPPVPPSLPGRTPATPPARLSSGKMTALAPVAPRASRAPAADDGATRRTAAKRFGGWALVAVALAAAAAGGAALTAELSRVKDRDARGAAAPSTSAAATATVLTRLPPPRSQNADALAAYTAAMQSFRDAAFESARQSFEKAIKLDPQLASAYFHLALLDDVVATDELDARRHYRLATQYRATLSERDQVLLDAFDPFFLRDPPDLASAEERLGATSARYPLDAEVAFYLGYVRYTRGRLRLAAEALARATSLDPRFGQAWAYLAGTQAYLGNSEGALATVAHCLEVSPAATDCIWYRALVHEQSGDCVAYEADVRRWIAQDPEDYYGYGMLAKALRANGKSSEAVQAALQQKWMRAAPERRRRIELADRARAAMGVGDFVESAKRARELEVASGVDPSINAHAQAASFLFDTLEESGENAALIKEAVTFLERKDAWVVPVRADDLAIASDSEPIALAVLARAGTLPREEAARRRRAWIDGWKTRTTEGYVNHLWIYGWAAPARSPEEAREALAALPGFEPLPPFTPQSMGGGFVGMALLAAGRTDEALARLERAAKTCVAFDEPVPYMRTLLALGAARAAAGKSVEACAAYHVVLTQWAAAKPSSRTADAARAAAAKLGCAK